MVFVVERNIFISTNQFSKTAQQSPQNEVAPATSSDVLRPFVILAQAGIQYFEDSYLRRYGITVRGVTT